MPPPKRRFSHDQHVLLYALTAGLPAVITSMCFLWLGDHEPKEQWTLTLAIGACWLGFHAT